MSSLDGLTSGISTTLVFSDIDGVKSFVNLESFQVKEDASVLKKIGIDGIARHPKLHQGGSGTCSWQRGSASIDRYFMNQEANYYLGGDQVDMTITQTILEVDGTTTQITYQGCVLTLDDAGAYSGTDIVTQSATVMFKRRIQLN